MTYLRSKSSPSRSLLVKSLPVNTFPSAIFPSTGSDLLDTLCNPSTKPEHKTLFEQVSTHGLGLQNIEIPQLGSRSAHYTAQISSRKKPKQNGEPLLDITQSSPRDRALQRLHRTVEMDRAEVDKVSMGISRTDRAAI